MKKEMTFEEAIEKLEEVTKELESNNLTLEESMTKFKDGMDLSKYCSELLDEAEKSINVLIEKNDGSMNEELFDIKTEEE